MSRRVAQRGFYGATMAYDFLLTKSLQAFMFAL